MNAKVTIHDVARMSGVSIKTVSRVLNREPNVKADTRDRVQEAVAALNYRPNISARSLAGSKAYLIGVFFDNPSPAYVTDVQLGAIGRCRTEGYHLIVEPLDSEGDVEEQVAPMLATLRMDGVILTPPVCDDVRVLAVLDAEGVPYVRLSPDRDLDRSAYVRMDDMAAAYEMTAHLIKLGHKDIAFIKGHPDHGAAHLRYDGYAKAMADHGLAVLRVSEAADRLPPIPIGTSGLAMAQELAAAQKVTLQPVEAGAQPAAFGMPVYTDVLACQRRGALLYRSLVGQLGNATFQQIVQLEQGGLP